MMITAMTKTEYEWSYEQVRQVLVPPVGHRRQQGRDRRQHQSFREDYVELSLDGMLLSIEEQLAQGWELFSHN